MLASRMRWLWRFGGCWLAVCALPAMAQVPPSGQVFGLAGKTTSDPNFIRAWQGCAEEAQLQGDRCVHLGAPGPAQARRQDAAIAAALSQPLAGLAVSVIHSALLAEGALKQAVVRRVPVITFDSDLEPAYRSLRSAYVGPDNVAFGRQLGQAARDAHPQGGTVCLLTDAEDPNLRQRVQGVRQALSQQLEAPELGRLQGQGGWREPPRCPWNTGDTPERAVKQVSVSLQALQADVVISVGHWPVLDAALFRASIAPLQADRAARSQTVLVAVGQPGNEQLALLRDGLVQAYASIDFLAMGREAYRQMKRLAQGHAIAPVTATPTVLVRRP